MGDPALSVHYVVHIDGTTQLGRWTKIEGLGFEYQVTEYREGGVNEFMRKIVGPGKYTNLRMSRPTDALSKQVADWIGAQLSKVEPQTMSISAFNPEGIVATWDLAGAVPVKWTGPSWDVNGSVLAMETLEVAYEQIIGFGSGGAAAPAGA